MHLLAIRIALRYLVARKSTNVINIITWVSIGAIVVMSAALIIVWSVFNGFEGLVKSLYSYFDPDIKIVRNEGKVFTAPPGMVEQISRLDGVIAVSSVLEENAILRYEDNEYIARLKGVDSVFLRVNPLDTSIIQGRFALKEKQQDAAVLGAGVAMALSVNPDNPFAGVRIYIPRRGKGIPLNPDMAFNRKTVRVSGIFSIQQEFDNKYVFVPIGLMQQLLDYKDEVSALEIRLKKGVKPEKMKSQIEAITGAEYRVLTRYEQNELLYKVMKTEKWVVYLILTFILIIASFNMIGSLSMLVLEKSRDISVLKVLGADDSLIRSIFLYAGMIATLFGCGTGLIAGFVICFIQQQFGIIKLQGSGTFVIDAYPVDMQVVDFFVVIITVSVIGLIATIIPANRAAVRSQIILEE